MFIIPASLNTQRNTRYLFQNKISHHVDQGMKRAGEATKGMKRSMWRTDNAKYGTSHISDVPLDLVNNSISTAEANKWKFQGGNFPPTYKYYKSPTSISSPARPPPGEALRSQFQGNVNLIKWWSPVAPEPGHLTPSTMVNNLAYEAMECSLNWLLDQMCCRTMLCIILIVIYWYGFGDSLIR